MRPVRISHNPEGDVVYITFGQPTRSTAMNFPTSSCFVLPWNEEGNRTDDFQLLSSFFGGTGDSATRSRGEPEG